MRRPRRGQSGEGDQAGWLLADLLLVLSVIVLGAAAIPDDVPFTGINGERARMNLPARPRTITRASAPGIERVPQVVVIAVNTHRLLAHDRAEIGQVRQQLAAHTTTSAFKGRQAALVLTFGCDPDAGIGSQLSHAVNAELKASNPPLFSEAVPRDFINMETSGKARLEIYLFTR